MSTTHTWPRDEWPYQYAVVELNRLSVDYSYQRPSQPDFVTRCIQPGVWDPRLIHALTGSVREGGEIDIALIDGQQRWLMLKELGYSTAPVLLHFGMSYEDEALLFARSNFDVKSVQAWYHYRALRAGKNPIVLAVDAILESRGMRMYRSVQPEDAIGATATLVAIYNGDVDVVRPGSPFTGEQVLGLTLDVLQRAWRGRLATGWTAAKTSSMLRGIARYVSANPDVSLDDITIALELVNPQRLLDESKQLTRGAGSGKGRRVEDVIARYVTTWQRKRDRAMREANEEANDEPDEQAS
jgi:hypothetical protein